MQKSTAGWLPVGQVIGSLNKRGGTFIRQFGERKRFTQWNEGKLILAFYNSGKNLFFDGNFELPTSHYCRSWHWIPFATFQRPMFIALLKMTEQAFTFFGKPEILFQHMGHDSFGRVEIRIGQNSSSDRVPCNRTTIPAYNILYVSVNKDYRVSNKLLVMQPLPCTLLPYGAHWMTIPLTPHRLAF